MRRIVGFKLKRIGIYYTCIINFRTVQAAYSIFIKKVINKTIELKNSIEHGTKVSAVWKFRQTNLNTNGGGHNLYRNVTVILGFYWSMQETQKLIGWSLPRVRWIKSTSPSVASSIERHGLFTKKRENSYEERGGPVAIPSSNNSLWLNHCAACWPAYQ